MPEHHFKEQMTFNYASCSGIMLAKLLKTLCKQTYMLTTGNTEVGKNDRVHVHVSYDRSIQIYCNRPRRLLTSLYFGRQAELEFEGHHVGQRLISPILSDSKEQTLAFVI